MALASACFLYRHLSLLSPVSHPSSGAPYASALPQRSGQSARTEAETDSESKDEITDDDEEKTQETPQKQYETVVDWELLNGNKAIWLRDPKDVEAEEYDKFYSALSKARTLHPLTVLPLRFCSTTFAHSGGWS